MPKMIINDEFIENYNQKYDEKENDIELLFNWNEIPGNDNEKLLKFLNQNFGIDWVKTATIEKIDDGRTDEFISKTKNCEIKIYDEEYKLIKRRVLNELKMNDTLSEDLFFKILDWKSPRVKGIIKKVKGYVLFREAIKNIAKEHPKYSLRQIDKALFAYHKYELKSKTSCGLEEACN